MRRTPEPVSRALVVMLAVAGAVLVPLPARGGTPAGPPQHPGAPDGYVAFTPVRGGFALAAHGRVAPLVVSAADHPGVLRAVDDLESDIQQVTGAAPQVVVDRVPNGPAVVLVGTLGRSPIIDRLVAAGRLDVAGVAGRWETSLQQVVDDPMPGVARALVIAGSDQRGTIFGVYDVSKRIGVSPWYWWDDVPARHHDALYVLPGRHTQGTPAVKYRGIFINDEDPQTNNIARRMFGGANHAYFEKVFETMLRLKANYLWPLTWGKAFFEDDPENIATAKRYGIVLGTSHEAPMMRAIDEWNRHPTAYGGTGEWSFRTNAEAVKAYWRDGIRRLREQDFEGVVTLGMRGNGDTRLPDGDAIELMQEILATQRQILAEEAGRPVTEVPQVWTLYKEVQRYWDKGLRVPDDATVVFTDDNWGNMRKLPDQSLPKRAGGYGLYYHFDYVGGSRSYKWADTANLGSTWEQLQASYTSGVDRLWVANVGDMKDNERPTQFFLDYAWNPNALPAGGIGGWERDYAAENFGPDAAPAVAGVMHDYWRLQSRRKPELSNRRSTRDADGKVVNDDTNTPFSIENYAELDRVTAEWQRLADRAEHVRATLPAADQDAFFELVGYAVRATANLYALRQAQFLNRRDWAQGRAATNRYADDAEARLADDVALSDYYNNTVAGGKWQGWQTQTKIGSGDTARNGPNASWASPPAPDRIYPELKRISVPATAEMGVAIDGSADCWPDASGPPVLPTFSPYQSQATQYIEVFNRGTTPFPYDITAGQPWLLVSAAHGQVTDEIRANVRVDWSRAPMGSTRVPITVSGAGRTVTVTAVVDNPQLPTVAGFVEANGYVSMQSAHYTRAVPGNGVSWTRIPDAGRDGSAMRASQVVGTDQTPGGDSPRLEYTVTLTSSGPVTVWAYLSPRNNVRPGDGVKYAVSIDDQAPKTVNATIATGADDTSMNMAWGQNTGENINKTATTFTVGAPGVHTVTFWLVDPTVVLQKLVLDTGAPAYSYLGPPESRRFPAHP